MSPQPRECGRPGLNADACASLSAKIKSRRWPRFGDSASVRIGLVAGVSLAAVLLSAHLVDVSALRIHGLADTLNDQAGYVSVARNLIASGELRSNIIYPSLLAQQTTANYLYMPGHYLALAAVYKLLGFGAIQSILPSIIAYIIAGIALFLTVSHFYGRNVGTTAALLFALFPANIVYSLTAMAEMTLLAAAMTALTVFVFLSFRLRVALGPILLVMPLLFRETGLVVGIVFFLLILVDGVRLHLKAAALFLTSSALIAVLVLSSPVSIARPSLAPFNILLLDENKLYADAFILNRINPSVFDWTVAPFTKIVHNTRLLYSLFSSIFRSVFSAHLFVVTGVSVFEVVSLGLILLGIPFGLLVLLRRPQHTLVIASVAVPAVLLLAILALYYVLYFQALRILLLAVPFECILYAVILRRTHKAVDVRKQVWRSRQILAVSSVAIAFALSVGLTYAALAPDATTQARADRAITFLDSLGHDPAYVLVTPPQIAFDYVYQHPRVDWSFLPANRATLELLNSVEAVGTIVLPAADAETDLTLEDVQAAGFYLEQTPMLDGVRYYVFKHSQPASRLSLPSAYRPTAN